MNKFCLQMGIMGVLISMLGVATIQAEETVIKAVAVIHPTKGNTATGKVTFTREGEGVRIIADIDGLTPGEHGFHIHEYGDCSSPDGVSTGGHFNPTNKRHGCPDSVEHHVGDMGNLEANEKGHAHYDLVNKDIKLEGDQGVVGRAVIIHGSRDDCVSQPVGNAGARIGCGVIGIAK